MRTIQLLFLLCSYFSYSQEQLSLDFVKNMYKTADIIFTGIVLYDNIINDSIIKSVHYIDFDITEIQKGKAYSRLIMYSSASLTFEIGKEYLVFAKRIKGDKKNYYVFYSEEVCNNCKNYTVKKVYEIIDKKPFATIKRPKEKTTWQQRGCSCH